MLVYVIAASVTLYFIYLFAFAGLSRKERARLLVCFILLISAAFFWSAFEQKPTSFNLFANDYTNRMVGGFEIPAVWFQSINALFIILLAPVFSWAWPALARNNVRPSSITKFVIGILCAAGGFRPDDVGRAECAQQRRRRRIADVAGGQYPDADAG